MNRYDAFMFAGTPPELLLLECRLTELYDHVDKFILVEGTTDHQGEPKPLNYLDHKDRYTQWADKLVYVIADDLPSVAADDWHWAREHAQREYIGVGLALVDAQPDDILMQSDLDEIPNVLTARNIRPQRGQIISCHQRGHFWAIDWLYPDPPGWNGTTACRVGALDGLTRQGAGPFAAMRDNRNTGRALNVPNGGWHFSWLGCADDDARELKHRMFCHKGQVKDFDKKSAANYYYTFGRHCDDAPMIPVDVDHTWPKWMQNPENVPANWYRPRDVQFVGDRPR